MINMIMLFSTSLSFSTNFLTEVVYKVILVQFKQNETSTSATSSPTTNNPTITAEQQ